MNTIKTKTIVCAALGAGILGAAYFYLTSGETHSRAETEEVQETQPINDEKEEIMKAKLEGLVQKLVHVKKLEDRMKQFDSEKSTLPAEKERVSPSPVEVQKPSEHSRVDFHRNCSDAGLRSRIMLHRGFHIRGKGNNERPLENTLPTYVKASELGFLLAECDIAMSKDGKLFLLHDTTLESLAASSESELTRKEVCELSWEEISSVALDDGSNSSSRCVLLETVLRYCSQNELRMMVEIKTTREESTIINKLIELFQSEPSLLEQVFCFASFDLPKLANLKSKLSALVDLPPPVFGLYSYREDWFTGENLYDISKDDWLSKLVQQQEKYDWDGFYLHYQPEFLQYRDRMAEITDKFFIAAFLEGTYDLNKDNLAHVRACIEMGIQVVNTDLPDTFWETQGEAGTVDVLDVQKEISVRRNKFKSMQPKNVEAEVKDVEAPAKQDMVEDQEEIEAVVVNELKVGAGSEPEDVCQAPAVNEEVELAEPKESLPELAELEEVAVTESEPTALQSETEQETLTEEPENVESCSPIQQTGEPTASYNSGIFGHVLVPKEPVPTASFNSGVFGYASLPEEDLKEVMVVPRLTKASETTKEVEESPRVAKLEDPAEVAALQEKEAVQIPTEAAIETASIAQEVAPEVEEVHEEVLSKISEVQESSVPTEVAVETLSAAQKVCPEVEEVQQEEVSSKISETPSKPETVIEEVNREEEVLDKDSALKVKTTEGEKNNQILPSARSEGEKDQNVTQKKKKRKKKKKKKGKS